MYLENTGVLFLINLLFDKDHNIVDIWQINQKQIFASRFTDNLLYFLFVFVTTSRDSYTYSDPCTYRI